MLIAVVVFGLFADKAIISAYTNKTGTVTENYVNVRTGAGTSYSKVYSGSTAVQRNKGDKVTIIGESYASDGKKWYNVQFTYTTGAVITGYMHSDYITIDEDITYDKDADFEKYMTKQGFPDSYKDGLRALHAKYPEWVFVADKLDYTFEEVVNAENVLGRSLINSGAISSYKSTEKGAYDWTTSTWATFDGTAWNAASKEIIAHYMDPRNFLTDIGIFQFELLSYQKNTQTIDGVNSIIKNTFMKDVKLENEKTYAENMLVAAQESGVSPFHIAARIISEQGTKGGSSLISGTVSGYTGLYNYFNQGAYTANGNSAVINGLIYAARTDTFSLRAWTTRYNSIIGGAKTLGKNYINKGQNTPYYEKFDFVGKPYTHQYMTAIYAANSDASSGSKAYTDEMKASLAITFKIPVFNNMPEQASPIPTATGSPNNKLNSLSISGQELTPSFNLDVTSYDLIVDNNVKSLTVSASAYDSKAQISGIGTQNLNVGSNKITIKVTAENGSVRDYTITVVRKEEDKTTDVVDETLSVNTSYKIEDGRISGFSLGAKVSSAISKISVTNGSAKILNADGTENTGAVATGNKVVIYNNSGAAVKEYNVVVYGDVNGDGTVGIKDLLIIRKQLLGLTTLEGSFAESADTNRGKDGITIKDLLIIRKQLLGLSNITQ